MSVLNEPEAYAHAMTMLKHRLQIGFVAELTNLSVRRVRDLRQALRIEPSQGRKRGAEALRTVPLLRLQTCFVATCFSALGIRSRSQLIGERGASFAQLLDFYYESCVWAALRPGHHLSGDEVYELLRLHFRDGPVRLRCDGCGWRGVVPESLHTETTCPACAVLGRWSRVRELGKAVIPRDSARPSPGRRVRMTVAFSAVQPTEDAHEGDRIAADGG